MGTNEQRSCTRENLVQFRDRTEVYGVTDDGSMEPTDFRSSGDSQFYGYGCDSCYEGFDGWQAALNHLRAVKPSDGQVVRVEVAS